MTGLTHFSIPSRYAGWYLTKGFKDQPSVLFHVTEHTHTHTLATFSAARKMETISKPIMNNDKRWSVTVTSLAEGNFGIFQLKRTPPTAVRSLVALVISWLGVILLGVKSSYQAFVWCSMFTVYGGRVGFIVHFSRLCCVDSRLRVATCWRISDASKNISPQCTRRHSCDAYRCFTDFIRADFLMDVINQPY